MYYEILKIMYFIYKHQSNKKKKSIDDDPNILIDLIDDYVVVNTIIDF